MTCSTGEQQLGGRVKDREIIRVVFLHLLFSQNFSASICQEPYFEVTYPKTHQKKQRLRKFNGLFIHSLDKHLLYPY